jgi:hypothetical protein
MRLSSLLQLSRHLIDPVRRKLLGGLQGLKPARNFIQRPKSIVPRQLIENSLQLTRISQWVKIFLPENTAQASQFIEHSLPFG